MPLTSSNFITRKPLQRIKGRRISLQNPHLPTWQSSRSPSLHYPQTPSFLQTTRIPSNTLNPSFAHLHTRPTSSTSSTLVGSETTPLGHTPWNTPTFAKKRTAATTLRLAWSHPLSYPVRPARRRLTTRTSPHKYVLTPRSNHQSSIYGASIDHNDLAHIPDRFQCRQPVYQSIKRFTRRIFGAPSDSSPGNSSPARNVA